MYTPQNRIIIMSYTMYISGSPRGWIKIGPSFSYVGYAICKTNGNLLVLWCNSNKYLPKGQGYGV